MNRTNINNSILEKITKNIPRENAEKIKSDIIAKNAEKIRLIQLYFGNPSDSMLEYLYLSYLDLETLKNLFPLKINTQFYENGNNNSFTLELVDESYSENSKKYYINQLLYEKIYFSFYNQEEINDLKTSFLNKYNFKKGQEPSFDKNVDVIKRVEELEMTTNKKYEFRFVLFNQMLNLIL